MAINGAVDQGDVGATLSCLRSADVGLYGVTPECAGTYQQELAGVKRTKLAAGEEGMNLGVPLTGGLKQTKGDISLLTD